MKTNILIALVLSVLAASAHTIYTHVATQDTPANIVHGDDKPATKPAARPMNTRPGVFVTDSAGNPVPMKVRKLNVDVRITGPLAVTTVDMTVYNPHDRVLEGEFEMPVAEGQTVSRFALDINGKLRDGVVVEKEKARAAFEDVIRQNIDPALLEITRGNTFRSRIYPLPARGTRRIVIAFEQELTLSSDGYAYTYPFNYTEAVDTFDLAVNVASFGKVPSLAGNEIDSVAFIPNGKSFTAEVHRTAAPLARTFRCAVPVVLGKPYTMVSTFEGQNYFAAFVPVAPELLQREKPSTITLLWDASLSGIKRDTARELALLDSYFRHIGNVSVTYRPFDLAMRTSTTYKITNGNWGALRSAIIKETYDGATQLGELPLSDITSDLVMVFSDGVSTIGQHVPQRSHKPVITVASSQVANHDVLRGMAYGTGGRYVNLAATTAGDALAQLTTRTVTPSIEALAPDFTNVNLTGDPANGMITVTGIFHAGASRFQAVLDDGTDHRTAVDVDVSLAGNTDTAAPSARLWARAVLDKLLLDQQKNEQAIVAMGKRFGLVTPGTSLIVLDRVQDYARHQIMPPANEPEMRTQYAGLIQAQKQDSAATAMAYMQRMRTTAQQFDGWYTASLRTPRSSVPSPVRVTPDTGAVRSRTTLGTVQGVVKDAEGHAVQGATVRVTGTRKGAITKSDGSYTITNVPPGHYDLKITYIGHQAMTNSISVQANSAVSHDATLIVGGTKSATLGIAHGKASAQAFASTKRLLTIEHAETAAMVPPASPNAVVEHEVADAGSVRRMTGEDMTTFGRGDGAAAPPAMPGVQASGQGLVARSARKAETQIQIDGLIGIDKFNGSVGNSLPAPADAPRTEERQRRDTWADTVRNDQFDEADYHVVPQEPASIRSYADYLRLRIGAGSNPAFFMRAADELHALNQHTEALRVLSNLAELESENTRFVRVLGQRLKQWKLNDLAVYVFQDVVRMRGEEPQSYRDLGLALEQAGRYQEAANQLWSVVTRQWDSRFPEVGLIALNELRHIVTTRRNVATAGYDTSMMAAAPVDIRVVLSWDSDNCDMDLWVNDPSSEKCYYGNRFPKCGARLSADLTGGYGPEEYMLPRASEGSYSIKVNYYGNRQQNISDFTTVTVDIYTHYGTPKETKRSITRQVSGVQQIINIGSIDFSDKAVAVVPTP